MKRVSVVVSAIVVILSLALILPAMAQQDENKGTGQQGIREMINADKDLVAVELKSGSVMIARIIRETKDQVFVENAIDSIEASFPRSKIANIRKPTQKELDKLADRLEEQAEARGK